MLGRISEIAKMINIIVILPLLEMNLFKMLYSHKLYWRSWNLHRQIITKQEKMSQRDSQRKPINADGSRKVYDANRDTDICLISIRIHIDTM